MVNKDGCLLARTSFVATSTPHNECGSNGLPLTPNSTKALGFGLELCAYNHPNICPYIDFKCGRDGRVFGVSQFHKYSLKDWILKGRPSFISLTQWTNQCLYVTKSIFEGLDYLNFNNNSHLALEPSKVLINRLGIPKISNFGMFHVTDCKTLVDFPLSVPKYASPETILSSFHNKVSGLNEQFFKSDVWTVCLMIIELFYGKELNFGNNIPEIFKNILSLTLLEPSDVFNKILSYLNIDEVENMDDSLRNLLEKGLVVNINNRYSSKMMSSSSLLANINDSVFNMYTTLSKDKFESNELNFLQDSDGKTVWHLWNLAGGDLSTLYASNSGAKTPPIQILPRHITKEGNMFGQSGSPENLYDPSLTELSLTTIQTRLQVNYNNINMTYPLISKTFEVQMMKDTSKLPLVIRENDFDYQVYRMSLCKLVLQSYPYIKDMLWKTTKIDIPPVYRGELWSHLLDVGINDIASRYCDIDKETPTITDRQLSVDIPRCHSYNKIMSSPAAHKKLRRILKAWLKTHPDLYYWQGLDSLCAVFVYWNFDNEARAFFSLSNFIDKYMFGLFRKINTDVLEEYLAVFSLLLSFHDPKLAVHMKDIEFGPNLFAIPWFLTMFAHVFPLHSIVHLWDTLLLGNSSFPLCVGVAILYQLRSDILCSDFNECILFFSELPQINIDLVMEKAINIFCQTPRSSTIRRHTKDAENPEVMKSLEDLPDVAELKELLCCQISSKDLINLCNLQGANGTSKAHISVIDIRSSKEFQRGSVPGSHNIPYTEGPKVPQLPIEKKKPSLVVIIGYSGSNEDQLFGWTLVKLGLKGVCVLRGGIEVLKPIGVLTIPNQRRKD